MKFVSSGEGNGCRTWMGLISAEGAQQHGEWKGSGEVGAAQAEADQAECGKGGGGVKGTSRERGQAGEGGGGRRRGIMARRSGGRSAGARPRPADRPAHRAQQVGTGDGKPRRTPNQQQHGMECQGMLKCMNVSCTTSGTTSLAVSSSLTRNKTSLELGKVRSSKMKGEVSRGWRQTPKPEPGVKSRGAVEGIKAKTKRGSGRRPGEGGPTYDRRRGQRAREGRGGGHQEGERPAQACMTLVTSKIANQQIANQKC